MIDVVSLYLSPNLGASTLSALPILYSFRRCPYAMRARMTLRYSAIAWEHREVDLKAKPNSMLDVSPKGTVPVLILPDGRVIDESIDIMRWSLSINDPARWYARFADLPASIQALVDNLEAEFKQALDGYKYSNHLPDAQWLPHRNQCESYLAALERTLANDLGLNAKDPGYADVALLPFIRQCANVDTGWFSSLQYPRLQAWLSTLLALPLFKDIMGKHPIWVDG